MSKLKDQWVWGVVEEKHPARLGPIGLGIGQGTTSTEIRPPKRRRPWNVALDAISQALRRAA